MSRKCADVVFCKNFVAQGGFLLLVRGLQRCDGRVQTHMLRALAIMIDQAWTRKHLVEARDELVTLELYRCLLTLIMSDTVLIVSRALHLLARFTEPSLADNHRPLDTDRTVAPYRRDPTVAIKVSERI